MVVSLGGITLKVKDDTKTVTPLIKRNAIAGSPRTNNVNLGAKNGIWNLNAFVKSVADRKALEALVGTAGLTFVDKDGDSFTVSITAFTPIRKNHAFVSYAMTLEEDS